MFKRTPEPRYTMSRSDKGIITCFPYGMDISNLIEVSTLTSMFVKFVSTNSMREYDCEDFYNQMLEDTRNEI